MPFKPFRRGPARFPRCCRPGRRRRPCAGPRAVDRAVEQRHAVCLQFRAHRVRVVHLDGQQRAGAAGGGDRDRLDQRGRVGHPEQVDDQVRHLHHGRGVVLVDHLEAEDLGVELLGRRQVLGEQGDDVELAQCLDHGGFSYVERALSSARRMAATGIDSGLQGQLIGDHPVVARRTGRSGVGQGVTCSAGRAADQVEQRVLLAVDPDLG